jgi:hypothetical protein
VGWRHVLLHDAPYHAPPHRRRFFSLPSALPASACGTLRAPRKRKMPLQLKSVVARDRRCRSTTTTRTTAEDGRPWVSENSSALKSVCHLGQSLVGEVALPAPSNIVLRSMYILRSLLRYYTMQFTCCCCCPGRAFAQLRRQAALLLSSHHPCSRGHDAACITACGHCMWPRRGLSAARQAQHRVDHGVRNSHCHLLSNRQPPEAACLPR